MDQNSLKFYAAELGAQIPTLDLHGFFPDQALEKLDIFIYQCVEKNADSARIIYGGGTGKLRAEVLETLKKYSVVSVVRDEGGSCVIIIK